MTGSPGTIGRDTVMTGGYDAKSATRGAVGRGAGMTRGYGAGMTRGDLVTGSRNAIGRSGLVTGSRNAIGRSGLVTGSSNAVGRSGLITGTHSTVPIDEFMEGYKAMRGGLN